MSHDQALQALENSFTALREGRLTTAGFCQTWRAQASLLSALPPRYCQVMEDLLGRLEAGSLFTEESCSFSQEDLLGNLTGWLSKARQSVNAQSAM
jgi:hypothetical protein